ncbi:hypothetical protein N3K66_008575 [Trichothecium roseum]|uniref:Uncharacterized protein n=1 Tax=Trichothecium roseum TaxID=47278 RepID=A0ACC0UQL1_9HYPO|nr:hypothetical protein N3K66_008575 [Trichothecium roseum]
MPADKPPPLPTPPNLHALQNRIALSLSARASLLSKSRPQPPSSSSSAPTPRSAQQQHATSSPSIAEEPDLRSLGDANAGVGYVPEGKDAVAAQAARAQDKVLRGRMLGKGRNGDDKANGKGLLRRAGEESDDEDLGRSALGRSKAAGGGGKKRKRPVAGEDDDNDDDDDGANDNNDGEGTASGAASAEAVGRSGVADDTYSPPQEAASGGEPGMATCTQAPTAAHNETTEVPLREKQKKNKKNKNKKKRKQGLP